MPSCLSIRSAVALLLALSAFHCSAEDVEVETLLSGLTNPCGVAVRPGDSAERYEIFVADSGAGRIVRIASDAAEPSAADVITGFELTELGNGELPVGPIGLLFLDRRRLAVGVSGAASASVQVFELPDTAAPVPASAALHQVTLARAKSVPSYVYAIGRTRANESVRDALFMSLFDNTQSGELRTIAIRADALAEPAPLGTAADSNGGSPAAIAVSDAGHVVVGWVGSLETLNDSRLAFYHPVTGKHLMGLETPLSDILGLAYSPRTGSLYAVDAAWSDAHKGGVFRIDASDEPGGSKCTAIKIAAALRPSALAFGPDGALYVTAFGDVRGTISEGILESQVACNAQNSKYQSLTPDTRHPSLHDPPRKD
jgi:hypothetical protein